VTDLGTLGGDWGDGYAINSQTQIVGQSATASGDPHAFLWDKGVLTDLGVPDGDNQSAAVGINNKGQIVGYSFAVDNFTNLPSHALLWENGQMIDLQTCIPANSGWTLLAASGINDRGQIVGVGIDPDGLYRNFVLTPH